MKIAAILIILLSAVIFPTSISPQTNTFNFQGRLNDGSSPANGQYDLRFKLFDDIAAGNQIGPTVNRAGVTLINGVFSTTLNFGSGSFTSGGARFIEISVRPGGSSNSYVVLGARQPILTVPFAARAGIAVDAEHAISADNATNAQNAQNSVNSMNAVTAQNSISLGGVPATGYAKLNVANTGNLVVDNLGSGGVLQVQGNSTQPGTSNGFVKFMVAITANGTIARCYNGVTGDTTGTCGITGITNSIPGSYNISFPFPVTNRFWLVTNDGSVSVIDDLGAIVQPIAATNSLRVVLRANGTLTNLPFHLFVF